MSGVIADTFQNTESKSAPWNLSGIPAAISLGPSSATNSSKSTWPSPAGIGVWIFSQYVGQPDTFTHVMEQRPYLEWSQWTAFKIVCLWFTIHVQPLDNDLQLHLIGHVSQWPHSHPQLLLWDVSVSISVKHLEGFTDLCGEMKERNSDRRIETSLMY